MVFPYFIPTIPSSLTNQVKALHKILANKVCVWKDGNKWKPFWQFGYGNYQSELGPAAPVMPVQWGGLTGPAAERRAPDFKSVPWIVVQGGLGMSASKANVSI